MIRISTVRVGVLLLVMAALEAPVLAATFHVDTFSHGDTHSWTGGATGGQVISVVPTGGPAGDGDGYLSIAQPNNFHMATHNQSSVWVGNFSSIGAGQISADMRSAPGSQPLAIRLVLFGPSPGADANRWVSNTVVELPDDGVWRTVQFALVESEFARLGGGTFAELMAGVTRVMFRHDAGPPSFTGTNVSGTLGIDNITLGPAPAPVLAGDYNDDGVVDAADYVVWRNHLGDPAGTLENDIDGGPIGTAQYSTWKAHFGETASAAVAGQAGAAIPGPSLLIWWGALASGLAMTKRRRQVFTR